MGKRRTTPRGRGSGSKRLGIVAALLMALILVLDFLGWMWGPKSYLFNLLFGPRRTPPSAETIVELIESEMAAHKVRTRPIHSFLDEEENIHLKIDLSPGDYSRLASPLRRRLEAAGASLLREQEESDSRAAYHLWVLRAAAGRRTRVLFSCLSVPARPPKRPGPEKPVPKPRRPAVAAIIMDDLGYNLEVVREACDLDLPLTLSILPFSPHAVASAQIAHEQGLEVMLHLPMESREHHETEGHTEGLLVSGMSDDQVGEKVREQLYQIPYIRGVNNHMGSLLTEDGRKMGVILSVLREYGLYFVDSRTSAASQALTTAQRLDVPALGCDLFLDASGGQAELLRNLRRLLGLAAKRGWALGIVHPYDTTLHTLRRSGALFKEYKVRLVPVSEVLGRLPNP